MDMNQYTLACLEPAQNYLPGQIPTLAAGRFDASRISGIQHHGHVVPMLERFPSGIPFRNPDDSGRILVCHCLTRRSNHGIFTRCQAPFV